MNGLLWARVRLVAPPLLGRRFQRLPIRRPKPAPPAEAGAREVRPYERMAALYHDYARAFCPAYVPFLRALARRQGVPLQSILELACGAGTLTAQLAAIAHRVVGLDLSEEMLAEARRHCSGQPHVRLQPGDFRSFDMGERFDAVVCASDSLNYVDHPEQLRAVFSGVARHLNPGGLFVCDAVDERGLRLYSGRIMRMRICDTAVAFAFQYDPGRRMDTIRVSLGPAIELHHRVPIEPHDVRAAAAAAGLRVREHFSMLGLGLIRAGGVRNFFVLQAPRAPASAGSSMDRA